MRQKQAEGTHFLAGLMTSRVSGFEGAEEGIEVEKHLETNLMAAFAKKDAGSASSGGKK